MMKVKLSLILFLAGFACLSCSESGREPLDTKKLIEKNYPKVELIKDDPQIAKYRLFHPKTNPGYERYCKKPEQSVDMTSSNAMQQKVTLNTKVEGSDCKSGMPGLQLRNGKTKEIKIEYQLPFDIRAVNYLVLQNSRTCFETRMPIQGKEKRMDRGRPPVQANANAMELVNRYTGLEVRQNFVQFSVSEDKDELVMPVLDGSNDLTISFFGECEQDDSDRPVGVEDAFGCLKAVPLLSIPVQLTVKIEDQSQFPDVSNKPDCSI